MDNTLTRIPTLDNNHLDKIAEDFWDPLQGLADIDCWIWIINDYVKNRHFRETMMVDITTNRFILCAT